jgi:hypothetical protein
MVTKLVGASVWEEELFAAKDLDWLGRELKDVRDTTSVVTAGQAVELDTAKHVEILELCDAILASRLAS